MKRFKLIALVITFTIASSTTAFSQTQSEPTTFQEKVSTSTIKVKGVTCSTDLKMISANVEKVEGVKSCKAIKQGATSFFEVVFDSQLVSNEAIYAAIEGTGSCEAPDERPYKVKQ